ncbi:MAG: hypothetical protein H0U20_07270, partial [Thermoleophilaceae bacterium]|nr:hypothetical protein [Thermoleophilaceae bacterium]
MAEIDVVPVGPFRMPAGGRDGVLRRRGGTLTRLLHVGEASSEGGEAAVVRAWV